MEFALNNILSPIVLCFVLGIVASIVKSDLSFPSALYKGLSIYLLFAIGLKGGSELAHAGLASIAIPALVTLILGVLTPLNAFWIVRKVGKFNLADASAVAAHYGSVSAVTFIAALTFADSSGSAAEGFMPTLVAILEIPGIIVALMLMQVLNTEEKVGLKRAFHEVVTGSSILLLMGGLAIGYFSTETGFNDITPFFVNGFKGALCLFLLELGMVTARRLSDLKKVGAFLIAFGILIPIVHGFLAVYLGQLGGLSVGGSSVLGAMVSSASYIAAPAAVRISIPQANPTYYLTASLGITFPFNLIFGIPLYFYFATLIGG